MIMQSTRRRPRPTAKAETAFSVLPGRLGAQLCMPNRNRGHTHLIPVTQRSPVDNSRRQCKIHLSSSASHFLNFSRESICSLPKRVRCVDPYLSREEQSASVFCTGVDVPVQQQNDNSKKQQSLQGQGRIQFSSKTAPRRQPKQSSSEVVPTLEKGQESSFLSDRRIRDSQDRQRRGKGKRKTSGGSSDEGYSGSDAVSNVASLNKRRGGKVRPWVNSKDGLTTNRYRRTRSDRSSTAGGAADFTVLYRGSGKEKASFLRDLRKGEVELNVLQFNEVVSVLSRQRKIDDALLIMEWAENGPMAQKLVSAKSVKTYTIMIDIYGKGFQLPRAFSLFYGMSRHGVKPNIITYNAMVAACSRNNEPDLAYEVFEEMEANGLTPDKFTYGALIDSCAKSGKVDRAFEISKLMDANRVRKDQTVYSALMDACGRTDQLERALMVFEEMKRKGVWPNLVTFSVLIDTCANAKEPERAFQLYSEMKHWGYPTANVVVFTALIDACSKSGWSERAELVMKKMISHGIEPNQISFGALMEAWAGRGRLDRAFEVLDRMVTKHHVLPNAVLLGGLIDATRRLRELWRVRKLWEIIMEYNLRPSKLYYPSLIGMAIAQGDVQIATAVLLHAYARGCLRRAVLHSEDPALHAIACAIVLYHHEVVKKAEMDGGGYLRPAVERVHTVFKSVAMPDETMELMSSADACAFCLSWGDSETKDYGGARVRGGSRKDKKGVFRKDSTSTAKARWAKDSAAAQGRFQSSKE